MNTLFFANLMGPQGLFILFVLLLLFGAQRLPELARGLGQAMREFSKAKDDLTDEIMREPVRSIEPPRTTEAQIGQAGPANNPEAKEGGEHPGATTV
jgi:sec-independent protein translocase protein TatA